MKVFRIFEIVNFSLYSIQFEGEELDEWRKLLRDWSDVEFLNNFFHENANDLTSGFYGLFDIKDAVLQTITDAKSLENLVLKLAKFGRLDTNNTLQTLFKPLSNSNYKASDVRKEKAYGLSYKSWLRLYALRIDENAYVITGGAIKLTETMNDREHLQKELLKLEIARNWFVDNQVELF